MQYQLVGDMFPAVEITLNRGEAMYTQKGGMTWQSEGFEMTTNTKGGLMKGIGRMFAGESLFMSTYTATKDNALIAFASTVPGGIIPVDLANSPGLIAQKGAFLAAEPGVELKVTLTKKFSSGLIGGEGFVLQDIHGKGTVFLEIDGAPVIKELQPGEVLKVDTGNVVAFEKTVAYEVETVKGFTNVLLGGEGLFLTKLTGPGKVILQTLNFYDFAGKVIAMRPTT